MMRDSETLEIFIKDSNFKSLKKKNISNIIAAEEKKIQNSFKEKSKKKYFEQNEKVYNKLLNHIIGDFKTKNKDSKFYENCFK